MIKLEVVDDKEQHFIVRSDQPVCVEVSVVDGRVVAHVYEGFSDDESRDPLGAYDGTLDTNESWEAE